MRRYNRFSFFRRRIPLDQILLSVGLGVFCGWYIYGRSLRQLAIERGHIPNPAASEQTSEADDKSGQFVAKED